MADYLTKDEFLNTDDHEYVDFCIPLNIPGYGGKVIVLRSWNGLERDEFISEIQARQKGKNQANIDVTGLTAWAVSKSIVDPKTKEPWFNRHDVEKINNKHAGFLDAIWKKVEQMNGLQQEEVESDVKKNS